jgi:hypothetical protein
MWVINAGAGTGYIYGAQARGSDAKESRYSLYSSQMKDRDGRGLTPVPAVRRAAQLVECTWSTWRFAPALLSTFFFRAKF